MGRSITDIGPDLDFNAEGKGPLSLPRMTSLGPASQASDNIGDIVFRGASIENFNDDEFVDNSIDGWMREMWVTDTEEIVHRYDLELDQFLPEEDIEQALVDNFRIGEEDVNKYGVDTGNKSVAVQDLVEAGLIQSHIEKPVTGGLSKDVGTSNRFAKPGTDYTNLSTLPLILFLERDRIEANLVEVEYNKDFVQEYPLMAGAADKGSTMFAIKAFNKDTYSNFFKVGRDKDSDEDKAILWFSKPLGNFYSLNEAELMAYTGSINLDHSLFGACIYFTESRLDSFASEHTNASTPKQQAEELYPMIQSVMDKHKERLVLLYHTGQTLDYEDKEVRPSRFQWLYDGQQFIEEYNKAVPFTNPRKF